MKLKMFIKDKFVFLLLSLFFILFFNILLGALKVDYYVLWFLSIFYGLVLFIGLGFEFLMKRNAYKRIFQLLSNLDEKYLLSELMEEPSFQEGKILFEILKVCNKSMNDHIFAYRKQTEDYYEYVETWVHEVKTPIAASKLVIENNRNLVTNSLDEEIDKIDQYIEQALYYARSTTIEKDYVIKALSLKAVVQEVVKQNAKMLIESKIRIEVEEMDQTIYSDSKWLHFIIQQIISNSIKYRQAKNPYIRFSLVALPNAVCLQIQDNGIGIDPMDLPKVLEKSFTGSNGRKYAKSTGMGLYLCDQLCKKMGLQLSISSKFQESTIVKIIFPATKRFNFDNK